MRQLKKRSGLRFDQQPTSSEKHLDGEGNVITIHFDASGEQIPPWMVPEPRRDSAPLDDWLLGPKAPQKRRKRRADFSLRTATAQPRTDSRGRRRRTPDYSIGA